MVQQEINSHYRFQCLELAFKVLEKSENVIYDKNMAGENVENDFTKNIPIVLECRGKGIQNAAMTYTNIDSEKVIQIAQRFYDFVQPAVPKEN